MEKSEIMIQLTNIIQKQNIGHKFITARSKNYVSSVKYDIHKSKTNLPNLFKYDMARDLFIQYTRKLK